MDLTFITGTIAGICMAVCQVPQAWQIYKTRNTEGLSLMMQIILTTGIFFWFLTGIIMKHPPMWISNGICLIFCIYVLVMCIITKNSKKK